MTPVDFASLAQQCAPNVHPTTLQAVVKTESGFNPFAIGVVGGHLARQPRSQAEAVATARALEAAGWNYSMGLAQVNRINLRAYGLDANNVFDPCSNLRAGASILSDCYTRALAGGRTPRQATSAAFSCYYSGNFRTGFRPDIRGTSYVQRVAANAELAAPASDTSVPAIAVIANGSAPAKQGAAHKPVRDRQAPRGESDSSSHPTWDVLGDF
ncbi:lytic transglycosylase [Burkholderia territorii]|uniref:lytic transglycosylase domain-containing protein n=1 Tax=Burkholderia territorii TaxID=1503055 RepID=UPI00075C578A|nr:lytic transglycosylase domain-containing protein [Burkholderia territorii]KVL25458.1 lytic transglycosylase [Burkholderia territorii]